jgi:hypothetical protein
VFRQGGRSAARQTGGGAVAAGSSAASAAMWAGGGQGVPKGRSLLLGAAQGGQEGQAALLAIPSPPHTQPSLGAGLFPCPHSTPPRLPPPPPLSLSALLTGSGAQCGARCLCWVHWHHGGPGQHPLRVPAHPCHHPGPPQGGPPRQDVEQVRGSGGWRGRGRRGEGGTEERQPDSSGCARHVCGGGRHACIASSRQAPPMFVFCLTVQPLTPSLTQPLECAACRLRASIGQPNFY